LETLNPYNFCSEFDRQIILGYSESARPDESNGIKKKYKIGGGGEYGTPAQFDEVLEENFF
jgi:hypothetical protein